MYGIHSGEPVSDGVFFAWNVFDLENIALEEDTPADDNRNLAAFNPDEISFLVSFFLLNLVLPYEIYH